MQTSAVHIPEPAAAASSPRPPWHAGAATGLGPLPGTDITEATRVVAGELPELPYLPELPERGVGADPVGRCVGLLVDIFGEVVPSGWRISRRPGRDTRRANDFRSWDSDAAHEQLAGAPWIKIQTLGPWSLAASIELPNGHRALTDAGAVNDLTTSLAEGVAAHVADLQRRIGGDAGVVIQVDEPLLPAAMAGALPTASGFGTVRSVGAQRAAEVLGLFTDELAGHPLVAHCPHPQAPLTLLREAGFGSLAINIAEIGTAAARLDPIGEAVEAGCVLLAGLVPAAPDGPPRPLREWAAPLLDLRDRVGFDRAKLPASVVPTPVSGLADVTSAQALRSMQLCREVARALQDPPPGW